MYKSTRSINESCGVPAAQAIKQGLAADGGLFMPEYIPKLPQDALAALAQQGYVSRAAQILSMFLDDYTIEELTKDCQAAYCPQKFPGGAAPCVQIDDRLHVLELCMDQPAHLRIWRCKSCRACCDAHWTKRKKTARR